MRRTLIKPDLNTIPSVFHPLFHGAAVYDSSCSKTARVYFIDKDGGYYLKASPKGSLGREAELTRFFHSKKLAAEVLAYETLDEDWLLTTRVPGEDCTLKAYRAEPERLCDTIAEILSSLHSMDIAGCPVTDHTKHYLETARKNYEANNYDINHFPDNWGFTTPKDAWKTVEECGHLLKTDTLLHGDYCLPNIMLDNWRFSGFIDLDHAGVGDRHVDLFWAAWSLNFNLKTNMYRDRLLDAYGRSRIDPDMFRVVAAVEVFG